MGFDKDKLIFDSTDPSAGDQIATYLYASDGTAFDHTTGSLHVDVQNVVSVDDNGSSLTIDNAELVSMDATLTALSKAEDSAHTTGDQGIQSLAVANHTEGALHSADGDYAPLQVDSSGRLRIIGDLDITSQVADDDADSGNPLKVGGSGVSGALTALSATGDRYDMLGDLYRRTYVNDSPNIAIKLTAPTVSTTEVEIAPTPQGGRRRIVVQNLSNKHIYIGPTGVLSTTGIRIAQGGTMELPWGEDIPLFAISTAGVASDVRVLEVA